MTILIFEVRRSISFENSADVCMSDSVSVTCCIDWFVFKLHALPSELITAEVSQYFKYIYLCHVLFIQTLLKCQRSCTERVEWLQRDENG